MGTTYVSSSCCLFGSAIETASSVTHSALDFSGNSNVLINYEGSNEKLVPHVGCRGPQLDFFVSAEPKNLTDLNRIVSNVEVGIVQEDGKDRVKVIEHVLEITCCIRSFLMPNCIRMASYFHLVPIVIYIQLL